MPVRLRLEELSAQLVEGSRKAVHRDRSIADVAQEPALVGAEAAEGDVRVPRREDGIGDLGRGFDPVLRCEKDLGGTRGRIRLVGLGVGVLGEQRRGGRGNGEKGDEGDVDGGEAKTRHLPDSLG